MIDCQIRGAMVFDGSGSDGVQVNVSINDGRIQALDNVERDAKTVVDAQGLALMPGIIDNHTHYDAQVTWDPLVSPSPRLGVTTAVIGNCGFTIAPCRPENRELIMRNLTQVEGMSIEVLRQGIDWQFESIPEYLDFLDRQGCLINLAAFVGHSSVRTFVMGDEAPRRAATEPEVAQMRELVLDGLRAGAIGFATSTSPAHNGHGGLPMPSRLADDAEMESLVSTVGEVGHGLFMLTKGGHTPIPWLEEMAATNGHAVVIAALLHNSTNPEAVFKDLTQIQEARERGHELHGAVSPCPLTNDFTLQSPYPVEGLQSWKPALGKQGDALKQVLADPAFRQSVRDELSQPTSFRLFNSEWHKVNVVQTALPENNHLEQKFISDIAQAQNADPLDVMLDLALQENLETVFSAVLLNSDEQAVGEMLRHPASLVSLSDAGAHLTFFNDAGFGLHLLGHWVRDRKVLDLPSAIACLTSESARVYGFEERGLIKAGYHADLMLFDPNTVGRGPKYRVHDLPGNGARLMTDPIGVHGVWVSGARIVGEDGNVVQDHQSGLPGKLIRFGQAATAH
jgi:N-acyl-D-aspartate/D-glutamate deacylase